MGRRDCVGLGRADPLGGLARAGAYLLIDVCWKYAGSKNPEGCFTAGFTTFRV